MTVLARHSALRGLIAPLVAFGAMFVALLFLTWSSTGDLVLLTWAGATTLPMLGLALTAKLRDRPAVAAGSFGVVTWIVMLAVLAGLQVEPDWFVLLLLGSGLAVAAVSGIIAERSEILREKRLPSNLARALTGLTMLGAVAVGVAIACPSEAPIAPRAVGERLGSVEIPALPTIVRERLAWPDHRNGIEVEVTSTPLPSGGARAEIVLVRDTMEEVTRSAPCLLEVGPNGRSIEVLASADAFEVRWPESPHGEVFGGCTYAQSTLRPMDETIRMQTSLVSWALALAPAYGLIALGLALGLRRRHARISRSPEVRVTEPGLAVMPDGAPAVVSAEIPMGSTLVALRLADVRPDYRTDARLSIEEHAIGEKAALLLDLARRVRTLELTALGGVALLVSLVLVTWSAGTPLAF